MRSGLMMSALVLFFALLVLNLPAWAQTGAQPDSPAPDIVAPITDLTPASPLYTPPTQKERFHGYLSWMFAPLPLSSAMFISGVHQAQRNPPDWQSGWAGFGQRLSSNLGTEMANATARYAISEALQEDTLYYPCPCRGLWPRIFYAVSTSFVARRGADGHRVFGVPEVLAPYAGPFASVYGWYPSRYGWKDAFRLGSHGLLTEIGTNISIEFLPTVLPRRARRWQIRLHLGNPAGASAAW